MTLGRFKEIWLTLHNSQGLPDSHRLVVALFMLKLNKQKATRDKTVVVQSQMFWTVKYSWTKSICIEEMPSRGTVGYHS